MTYLVEIIDFLLEHYPKLLKNKSLNKKNFLKKISWLFAEKAAKICQVLIVGVVLAKYLGPTDFGVLSFALSISVMFAAVANLGMNNVLSREIVYRTGDNSKYMTAALLIAFVFSVVIYGVLAIYIHESGYEDKVKLITLVVGLAVLFQCYSLMETYFLSSAKNHVVAKCGITAALLSVFYKLTMILLGLPLEFIAWAYVLDFVVLFSMYLVCLKADNLSLNLNEFSFTVGKNLLKQSWPYIASAVLVSIYMKIDQIMIMQIMGSDSVGKYSAAVRLSESWYFFPIILVNVIYPRLADIRTKSVDDYNSEFTKLYSIFIIGSLSFGCIVAYYSDLIIGVIYGSEYSKSSEVLAINAWTGIFVAIGVLSDKWLLDNNAQILVMVNTALGALMNVVLNLLWIPEYGISGAAWATLLSQGLSSYISLMFWDKTRLNFILITKSLRFGFKYAK